MKLVLRLVLAGFRQHPARLCLTSLATVAAAAVVVWVVSGYDALVSQFDDSTEQTLGRYDLLVLPGPVPGAALSEALLEELRRDAAVAEVTVAIQIRARVAPAGAAASPGLALPARGGGRGGGAARDAADARPGGAVPQAGARPFFGPALVGIDAAVAPFELAAGRWLDPVAAEPIEGVLSRSAAERLGLGLDGEVRVLAQGGEYRVRIVGLSEAAAVAAHLGRGAAPGAPPRGPPSAALYVAKAAAERIGGVPAGASYAYLRLQPGEDPGGWTRRWAPRLAASALPAEVVDATAIRAGMAESRLGNSARQQAYAATGMALLAALFIIFTTLSMGVQERLRHLAILRAVALTRLQVAATVVTESLSFAVIGWLGGLAAGWGLLAGLRVAHPALFPHGARLGAWCLVLSGLTAIGGALAAAVLPAWRAAHVSPLEASSTPLPALLPRRLSWPLSLGGLLLIAVPPLLLFVVPMPDAARYPVYAAVGCTTMAIGFLLLAPLVIGLAESLGGPCLAVLLGLSPALLRSQLSNHLWRTLGTTVALTLGLGLYVATMTWGYSMLAPFTPGAWVPDVLAAFTMGGLPPEELAAVRRLPGVDAERCLPLAVEQPRLADDITGSQERASVTRQDTVIMVGLEPRAGLGGTAPLLPLRFTAGSAAEAVRLLSGGGRHCVVPDHFAQAAGLGLGERFRLIPPEDPDTVVEYTIAGIVALPGWHWMTKFSGLRRRSARAAAMIVANYDEVAADFRLDRVHFIWMNITPGTSLDQLGEALRPIAERHCGQRQPVNEQGTWDYGARRIGTALRLSTPEEVGRRIRQRSDGIIRGMCQLPLVTLLIAALAVVNTIMASVRSRRWELGLLRAVGLTRGALVRLILAEAVLIGLAACLLSLAFGLWAGWCGTGLSQYVSFFGGMETPLVIPWGRLALGFAGTLALCLAAALWPAFSSGRAEPLTLLRNGRGAM